MTTPQNIDENHPDYKKAIAFMAAWEEGQRWADSLKVGDIFLGSMGEAKARYTDEYAISAFTTSGYMALQAYALYVDDKQGTIVRLERRA